MTKVTTGLAGAVRIASLKLNELTAAENHGKRLDESSKSRVIYPGAEPLTTTGLDLHNLYKKHVDGVFIPKNHNKALHVIVQFPTALVDGEDPNYMLKHAEGFLKKVFGPRAIFANRVDRDESGRHIVDVFVAPIYQKVTKNSVKDAVGLSVHMKQLAEYYYPRETRGKKKDGKPRDINVYDIGRALQSALHDYLQHEMGLTNAVRGEPKLAPGPDWKSAEALRDEELSVKEASAATELARAEADRKEAQARLSAAQELQSAVLLERDRQAKVAGELQDAFRQLEVDQHEVARQMAKANDAEAQAQKILDQARKDTARLSEDRYWFEFQQKHLQASVDLLTRGIDDKSELMLQSREQEKRGFVMSEAAMNPDEKVTYSNWPMALRGVAIALAKGLEKVRAMHAKLLGRGNELDEREAALQGREEHFALREASLANETIAMKKNAEIAAEQVEAARCELDRMQSVQQSQSEWAAILKHHVEGEVDIAIHRGDDEVLRVAIRGEAPDWMHDRVGETPPPWAQAALKLVTTLNVGAAYLEEQQREADQHVTVLRAVVAQAEKAFTPAQKQAVAAAETVTALSPAQIAARLAAQRDSGRG